VQEGNTTAGSGHPNVVPVYGRGETDDGQLWMAMQYIQGTDAEAALQAGTMTPARAVHIVAEVAAVLDYAHSCSGIHQDVKPSNILLGEGPRPGGEERVYLSDFGAALMNRSDPPEGPMMASVAYAAPEVIMGHAVDCRADVYSLGCTLFRLLTNLYRSRVTVVSTPPSPRTSNNRRQFCPISCRGPTRHSTTSSPPLCPKTPPGRPLVLWTNDSDLLLARTHDLDDRQAVP
jgi:serine/threonine protein kinase